MTRTERQEITLNKIIQYGANCWIDATMGYGKTRVCINVIKKALEKSPSLKVLIVVPTNVLKTQWENLLADANVPNYTVLTINAVISLPFYECDLCIVDEVHLVLLGNKFRTLFNIVKRKALLAVSGTWSYEHKQVINKLLPLADTITEREAIRNGWVSKRCEYSLFIPLSDDNQILYNEYAELSDKTFAHFERDWHVVTSCLKVAGAENYIIRNRIALKDDNGNYMTIKQAATFLSKKANIYMQTLQKRNAIINNSREKINCVIDLVNALSHMKIVTFGLKTETADLLTNALPDSISYHSKLKSKLFDNSILEKYELPTGKSGNQTKLTAIKIKELYIKMLEADDVTCIHSAKALDVGLDVKGMNCAITYARNSNKEKQSQRSSRTSRAENDDKVALFIHVVLKDTKDESWYKSATRDRNIKSFDNINDLIVAYEEEKKYQLNN